MPIRTTQTTVRFAARFGLPGLDEPLPPGEYRIDQDEQLIEGKLSQAWLRVGAFIHLPAIGSTGPLHQMLPISPAELDAAITKD